MLPVEEVPVGWTDARFDYIIKLKQELLSLARFSLTDYYISLDCDMLLTENAVVELLVEKQQAVVAPMRGSAGLYSNYWGGMTKIFYY